MKFRSHPTAYAGVNFRSRLEARWAAFYDLCGWRWAYEPFDLEGWTPDFSVGDDHKILVEVKPLDVAAMKDEKSLLARPELAKAFKHSRAERDTDLRPVLLCGLGPFQNFEHSDCVSIGPFLGHDFTDLSAFGYAQASRDPEPLDLCETTGCFRGILFGLYDGNPHITTLEHANALWNRAGSIVQWRGRGV